MKGKIIDVPSMGSFTPLSMCAHMRTHTHVCTHVCVHTLAHSDACTPLSGRIPPGKDVGSH